LWRALTGGATDFKGALDHRVIERTSMEGLVALLEDSKQHREVEPDEGLLDLKRRVSDAISLARDRALGFQVRQEIFDLPRDHGLDHVITELSGRHRFAHNERLEEVMYSLETLIDDPLGACPHAIYGTIGSAISQVLRWDLSRLLVLRRCSPVAASGNCASNAEVGRGTDVDRRDARDGGDLIS
jgi:hypothetical protein